MRVRTPPEPPPELTPKVTPKRPRKSVFSVCVCKNTLSALFTTPKLIMFLTPF